MATLSSNQLQSSHFRHVEIPAIRILAGEASKSVKTQDESPSPREASNNEETSPSEQESDFEEGLEGEQISIHNDHENLNSNPNRHPNSHPSNRNLQIKIALRIRTNINRRNKRVGKALDEFRFRLENALQGSYLLGHSHKDENPRKVGQNLKDITLWGVPLLPSKGHEGTNVILLKFLKAQDYKAPEALEMLRQTLIWRDKQGIDRILEEELEDQTENELNKVVFMDNVDKDGHPLCFNLYGAFKDRELYSRTFGTEKKREEFLRWRVQLMEKSIRKLNFEEGGVNSFLFISDMKNAPRPGSRMKELSQISKDAVCLFQRHYPELIYKHIIVNTPLWCYLYHSLISQYCTHGTRKKFVFARPYRVTETLLRYIPPQNIPIQYGGLRREDDEDFTTQDEPQEFSLRPGAVSTFQISMSEVKVSIVWEVMVVGWDVTYKDEFIPNDEGSYKILLQKKKINGETVRHSFYINEPGKILITIKNTTYIKKRAFIRYKTKVILPVYMCTPE